MTELDRSEERALVMAILHRPLAYDALGDGAPGLTVARLAQLAGVRPERAQEIILDLVDAGVLAFEVEGHQFHIELRDGAPVAIRGAAELELALSAAELLAEHTGNTDFLPPARDRTELLDFAARRVEQLAPAGLTRQQRDHLVSLAETAAITAESTVDAAIFAGISEMTAEPVRAGHGKLRP